MDKSFILFIVFLFISNFLAAQDSRNVSVKAKTEAYSIANAKQASARLRAFNKHPYNIYYDRLIVEYEQRMKANVRKYRVMARKMEKPQYSDPSYFGHKNKPKKRPVGKRKYCKECEIVH